MSMPSQRRAGTLAECLFAAHFASGAGGIAQPQFRGLIRIFRSSYGVPSNWIPIWPERGTHLVTLFCTMPLTVHSIEPSLQMISHTFHSPTGFSLSAALRSSYGVLALGRG